MIRSGHVIGLCVFALLTVGVVMVNSAGMAVAPPGSPEAAITAQSLLFSKSTVYMALAIFAMVGASMLPIRSLARTFAHPHSGLNDPERRFGATLIVPAILIAAMIVVLASVYVPGLGKEINGANRWLRIPVPGLGDAQSLQPSELVKWGMVILVAWYAATRVEILPSFFRGLVPALAGIGAVAAFIALEDLGTAVLVAASTCIVLAAGGARVWQFMMFVPVAIGGFVFAVLKSEYRVARILAFLDPYSDPEKTGYHMIQSMTAVAGGEGFGRGLGHGQQKFDYLPEDQTDFLFAIVCEELGIAGAGIVIGLFAAIIIAGVAIVRREREPFLKLLALGILSTVGLQALINLAVVTGLGPTKGIALPLVSSGGTGWILTAFSLGLLSAIDRTQDHAEQLAIPHDSVFSEAPVSPEFKQAARVEVPQSGLQQLATAG